MWVQAAKSPAVAVGGGVDFLRPWALNIYFGADQQPKGAAIGECRRTVEEGRRILGDEDEDEEEEEDDKRKICRI